MSRDLPLPLSARPVRSPRPRHHATATPSASVAASPHPTPRRHRRGHPSLLAELVACYRREEHEAETHDTARDRPVGEGLVVALVMLSAVVVGLALAVRGCV